MPERSAAADFNSKFISEDTPFPAGVPLFSEKRSIGPKKKEPV